MEESPDIAYPIAVISDVHGNVEALQTVLEDIDRRQVAQIVCLGDNVGYGPDPCTCLDMIIERCDWSLMGNHDFAVLYEPTNFNTAAEAAAFWTRQQLVDESDVQSRQRRWTFLGQLYIRHMLNGMLCVHGSPRRPINEYIFADDVATAPSKMQQLFDRIDRFCLVGHTHVQGVFVDEPDFFTPDEVNGVYRFNEREKAIINVGSVGQPRDRDPRSAYAVLFDDRVEFVRLEYDIAATIRKVEAVSELNDFFGQRLCEGR